MMKIERYLTIAFCLCLFTACNGDDNNLLCYGTHTELEGDITTYGAVGDGKTDCSKAINSAIASLPSEGGVLVIPEGDFVLDAPIVINKNNVTLKGLNPGMRSNIDVNGIMKMISSQLCFLSSVRARRKAVGTAMTVEHSTTHTPSSSELQIVCTFSALAMVCHA